MGSHKAKLWEKVRAMEEAYDPMAKNELGQIRATILVNFGPQGRIKSLVKDEKSTLSLMCDVLAHYVEPQAAEGEK